MPFSESDLSKGDKILRDLAECGVIELPLNKDYNEEYIESYLKRMDLDTKYCNVLNELLDRINEHKIGNPNARLSTKISALIFLLIISKKYDITPEKYQKNLIFLFLLIKLFIWKLIKIKILLKIF